MLVLFETSAGFAIFKVLDEKKLQKTENLFKEFETPDRASKIVQLQDFKKFFDSNEAMQAGIALNEGKLCKPLKKILKKNFVDDVQEKLMVWDPKLGSSIKDKLGIQIVSSGVVGELMRCIKSQVECLIPGLEEKELSAMSLGLAHNLSRYKLKFSPDKVDTMIIQAVNLLDDIDKELNNYVMRAREWYGWHFPELGKILVDNIHYIKCIMAMGTREKACDTDFSQVLPEDLAEKVKEAAEVSMGTEIADDDIENILCLCEQIKELSDYRLQLNEYLTNRMQAIAPNLNILVGELVGARLISHAGSLLNLAKHPASTIQILGAEKALFRALKTRKSTPKYGLIYHAHMVGQSSVQNKGKMSRMLAAKAALAVRYDALGEETDTSIGMDNRVKLNSKLNLLESGYNRKISGLGKSLHQTQKYFKNGESAQYYPNADSTMSASMKRKFEESSEAPKPKKMKVELNSERTEATTTLMEVEKEEPSPIEKKKKKKKSLPNVEQEVEEETKPVTEEKKKKKKSLPNVEQEVEEETKPVTEEKKKKKKKKNVEEVEVKQEIEEEVEVKEKKKKKKKKASEVDEEQ